MSTESIQKLFKNALQGKDSPDMQGEEYRGGYDEEEYYVKKLASIAEELDDFIIEYAIAQSDEDYSSEETLYIDQATELQDLRNQFFEYIEESAGLLNCTATDICAALGENYDAIFKAYTNNDPSLEDGRLLHIIQKTHEELIAFQCDIIDGYRNRHTLISNYLENQTPQDYVENQFDSIMDGITTPQND